MKQFSLKLRIILLCDYIYKILVLLVLVYAYIYIRNYQNNSVYDINDNAFVLTVKSLVYDGNKLSIEFKEKLIGTYYFETLEEKEYFLNNYSIGDKVSVLGNLNLPKNNTIKNMFNYKEYLFHKGIKYILKIENMSLISKSDNVFIRVKNYIYERVRNINNNDYLYAFILGKSSYIDSEIYENYRINGITHLFALSGLHVSLFSGFLLKLFDKFRFNEKISFILTSIFLIFFSFVASFTPSILRAVIFFILSNLNKIYYTFVKPKNILYLTFCILTMINPNYLFNTGFILSFTITLSILLFNEKFKINNNYISILVISIVSFLSSLPIIINMSYEINIIGFINNLFFIPFVTYIVFPLSLLTILFDKLNIILLIFTNVMEAVSSLSTRLFNLSIYFSKINTIEIIIYYLIFIITLKGKLKQIILLIIFIFYLYIKPLFDKNTYVYYLDVGQGDSILLMNNKESILIDTGGKIEYEKEEWTIKNNNFNITKDSLIPFFKSIGIKQIDVLIITHGDADHIGEAINLINNFKVEKVIFNIGNINYLENELINELNKRNISYLLGTNEIEFDNSKLLFLNNKDLNNENENSNVIYLNYNDYKFLFMGDAGIKREKELLKNYNIYNIDFFKVGHHGSSGSSCKEFIDSISPEYSIISVGKDNKFGHPKDEVLETLKNSKIYRTDIDGSIEIKLNKNGYKIKTCPP